MKNQFPILLLLLGIASSVLGETGEVYNGTLGGKVQARAWVVVEQKEITIKHVALASGATSERNEVCNVATLSIALASPEHPERVVYTCKSTFPIGKEDEARSYFRVLQMDFGKGVFAAVIATNGLPQLLSSSAAFDASPVFNLTNLTKGELAKLGDVGKNFLQHAKNAEDSSGLVFPSGM